MSSHKALATFGTGPMKPILRLVLPTFVSYADRHGYDLVVGTGNEAAPRPHSWSKIPLFRQLLAEYETVLWIDSDAVIKRGDLDLDDLVPRDAWQAVVEIDDTPAIGRHINLGVWLIRSDPRAFDFLDTLWASEDLINHPWWENAAALRALGYSLEHPLRQLQPTKWSQGTFLLPPEWNSLYRHPVPNARIDHYSGVSNLERAHLIREARGLPRSRLAELRMRISNSSRLRRLAHMWGTA